MSYQCTSSKNVANPLEIHFPHFFFIRSLTPSFHLLVEDLYEASAMS